MYFVNKKPRITKTGPTHINFKTPRNYRKLKNINRLSAMGKGKVKAKRGNKEKE
jgi:hypothetical protein